MCESLNTGAFPPRKKDETSFCSIPAQTGQLSTRTIELRVVCVEFDKGHRQTQKRVRVIKDI